MSTPACLYCDGAGCHLCRPARRHDRFPGATPTQAQRAQTGRYHPMGHRMPVLCERAAGETCGGCAHLIRSESHSGAKVWLKCGLAPRSGGRATDTRARWPACQRWEERP